MIYEKTIEAYDKRRNLLVEAERFGDPHSYSRDFYQNGGYSFLVKSAEDKAKTTKEKRDVKAKSDFLGHDEYYNETYDEKLGEFKKANDPHELLKILQSEQKEVRQDVTDMESMIRDSIIEGITEVEEAIQNAINKTQSALNWLRDMEQEENYLFKTNSQEKIFELVQGVNGFLPKQENQLASDLGKRLLYSPAIHVDSSSSYYRNLDVRAMILKHVPHKSTK